jgi:glycosyltransferase involved in cell wall biosynthesis
VHVVLNAQLLSTAHTYRSGGISRYSYCLLQALRGDAGGHRVTALVGGSSVPAGLEETPTFRVLPSGWPSDRPAARIVWEQAVQPLLLRRLCPDVLHGLSYALPLAHVGAMVVTVLDLSFLRFPEYFNRGNRIYLSAMTRLAVRRARRVIAISEFTRTEIVRLLGVSPERVAVVHCGVDERFRPVRDPAVLEAFRRERGLPERFILYLGTIEPRKNLERLLDAYARVRRHLPHKLVLAGGRGWKAEGVYARIAALDLERDVLLPGYVPMEEQPLWYNGADVYVYPSLYEGFGLPPLEAMACGTPVVAARAASLPEVLGDAAVLVDPLSVDALSEALLRVASDADLRRTLGLAGVARAEHFTWTRTALQTLEVYRQVEQLA